MPPAVSNTQRLLNYLAKTKTSATIENASFGWATLLHYQPFLTAVVAQMELNEEEFKTWLDGDGCYVFEIGMNCGDVFSTNMVEKIELLENGAIIHLK